MKDTLLWYLALCDWYTSVDWLKKKCGLNVDAMLAEYSKDEYVEFNQNKSMVKISLSGRQYLRGRFKKSFEVVVREPGFCVVRKIDTNVVKFEK